MNEIQLYKNAIYDPSLDPAERLNALSALYRAHLSGIYLVPDTTEYVNNHIHTTFSFSPYTPCAALYEAWRAGLATAGIMDHDSVGGAKEFIEAGRILGMPVTVGCELRVSLEGTRLYGRRLNNPDQISCAYVALHGIPHQCLDDLESVLCKKRELRNERNRKICENINSLCAPYNIVLSFDDDVLPLSQYERQGSVTERHIMFALVEKITASHDRESAVALIEKLIGSKIPPKKRESVLASPDKYYKYDLLGILKSSLMEKVYVDADDELLNIRDYINLCDIIGAISAYAYLGDVAESPTGDKKAQKFEDDFLNMLFDELVALGFDAVTYMPSRNTPEQLSRVMRLCREHGLFQISGEDINQPRQSFICEEIAKPEFRHLKKSTFALIGHEICATKNLDDSMFSKKNKKYPLETRIDYYSTAGGYGKR
ncbi:MAG: PHP domain-containing protein [Clostridia bacterium]|nr:PHP domain-containing protein [Clostridia bacterium]